MPSNGRFLGCFLCLRIARFWRTSRKLAFEAEQQKDIGSGDSATPQVPPSSRGAQGATGASPQFIDESFLPQREQLSVEEFNRLNQPRRRKGDSQ